MVPLAGDIPPSLDFIRGIDISDTRKEFAWRLNVVLAFSLCDPCLYRLQGVGKFLTVVFALEGCDFAIGRHQLIDAVECLAPPFGLL